MQAPSPIHLEDSFFTENRVALALVSLFDHIPGVIFFAKDRQSRFIAANSAMLAAKNITNPLDLLGKTDRDFHPPALAEAYITEDLAVMKAGEPLPHQIWFILDQSGRPGWFNSSKVPLIDKHGKAIGIAGVRFSIDTPEDRERQFKSLAPVFRYLEEHYAETVSIKEMAKLAGLSASHFNRTFTGMIGLSPTQFLHSIRIEQAKHLLVRTDREIADIALATGYHDQSHFTKHFRRLTGVTPRAYRMRFSPERK